MVTITVIAADFIASIAVTTSVYNDKLQFLAFHFQLGHNIYNNPNVDVRFVAENTLSLFLKCEMKSEMK